MFKPFLSDFKTILTGSSFLGLRSSVFVLYPPVKSAVVSRSVCYCTEFDLVSSFFVPRFSVVFAIIGMLHWFLCRKGFRSEMTGFEVVVNVFPSVVVTLRPVIVFVVVGFQLCTSLQPSRESCSLKIKLFNL